VITITGIGDHLRPEWPITITGTRTGTLQQRPAGKKGGFSQDPDHRNEGDCSSAAVPF
jgi:hypothetical protein